MARLLKLLILVPVAIIVVAFALANRHVTTVSFDPFSSVGAASVQIIAPLFLILFATLICGVILGSCATWLTQGKSRRAARVSRAEAERLRGETERLRAQMPPSADRNRALFRPELSR